MIADKKAMSEKIKVFGTLKSDYNIARMEQYLTKESFKHYKS